MPATLDTPTTEQRQQARSLGLEIVAANTGDRNVIWWFNDNSKPPGKGRWLGSWNLSNGSLWTAAGGLRRACVWNLDDALMVFAAARDGIHWGHVIVSKLGGSP